ncbi:MAG: LysR family transcriptional regulator [Alphaproteobacteria bacterium]|nr:LysR family transcriptional regulator [Alphaproteobacteria bacterium]MDE2012950.1 LysR family transcriptional regulator [Alphaproteobacteria bacterium]MDE2074589.1 LysR family transcriptional regulator [Alphaproteobacteria bacterium]MDE2351425.1 LysR family transcriptional regulator [Alphaproteobacteria bacterium]
MMEPFEQSQKSLNRSPLDDPRVLSGPFWGELRVFLAVAKAKSFNRAAEELKMSQPTVSRQVKRLQDVIGSQLVVPTQAGIKLTERGKELALSLIALDEKLFEISHSLKAEKNEAEGLVRLSVTEGLAGLFVAPNLIEFSEQFPKIQLHIRNPINLTSLRENQTDVMIAFGPVSQSDITAQRLGYIHFVPVVTQAYVERFGMPNRSNLERHLFIDSEYYSAHTGIWENWHELVAQGVIAHQCDNSFAYALLVKSGLGIGLLGTYTLVDPVTVPLDLGVHVSVPIYILSHTERLTARPVRLVYDWLSTVFSPTNPWFAPELRLQTCTANSAPLSAAAAQLLAGPQDIAL